VAEKKVEAADAGIRLDRWFRRHYPFATFTEISKWARKGEIRLNGKRVKASDRVQQGDTVRVPPQSKSYEPLEGDSGAPAVPPKIIEKIAEAVIYEDDDIIVINKPAGQAAQGGSGLAYGLDSVMRIFLRNDMVAPVHRLDKDTTGVLAFAKNQAAAARWGEALRSREAKKTYLALVCGSGPKANAGEISDYLAKRRTDDGERMVSYPSSSKENMPESAKAAVTRYRVLGRCGNQCAFVALEPLTGRTHQLRVHMANAGCPIIGDYKYGYDRDFSPYPDAKHMFLHASELEAEGKRFVAPLPKIFADALERLVPGDRG